MELKSGSGLLVGAMGGGDMGTVGNLGIVLGAFPENLSVIKVTFSPKLDVLNKRMRVGKIIKV